MGAVKVLYDHDMPFLLAHGGFQVQIKKTVAGIAANDVEMEPLRWWDENQQGDLIHFFGRPGPGYARFAAEKGIKLVILPLLSGVGSRPGWALWLQRHAFAAARATLPASVGFRLGWDSFHLADACIANTEWEAHLMRSIFATPPERVHIVANGIEDVFAKSAPVPRGPWLVCTAVITERKRILELAQAAVLAGTPIWIIGKAYSETNPYAQAFFKLARQNPKLIRYEGPIDDRARLAQAYRQARGFVLLSTKETLSLSSFEAAACECPMLLSDLPWATTTFKEGARYCPIASPARTAKVLREFYDLAPTLPKPPKPLSWVEIGGQFKRVYEFALASKSR